MTSNGPGKTSARSLRASALRRMTPAPSARQLRAAVSSAVSEMSAAYTCAPGSASARVAAMQPLPVPTSSSAAASVSACAIHAASSSVSGRGISTPSRTANVRPQNSVRPTTYCTGRPAASWPRMSSSSAISSGAPGSVSRADALSPDSSETATRAMLRASRAP